MTTSKIRKPSIVIVGVPQEIARALQPVKTILEMITGATGNAPELKGLKPTASNEQIVSKLNEVIRRLNASGGDHV